MINGPVLIVNDDTDDQEFLQDAWKQLQYENPLIFFTKGEEVIRYLESEKTTPFLILCDVNLPRMDGFELKEKLLEDDLTNYKSIPFLFWSSEVSKAQIEKAYNLGVNGFFVKDKTFHDLKESLSDIVNYWKKSKMPEL